MNYIKKTMLFAFLLLLLQLPAMEIQAAEIHSASAEFTEDTPVITPFSSDIQWRYKTVNGKLYKRKYNYSTKKWIGNWIPV